MKTLITGGAGFIGKEVAKYLSDVKVFDLVNGGGSILDPYQLREAIKGCNRVIHLAAMLGVKKTDGNPLQCLNVNIQGTINVLDACLSERVDKIVFVSSSEVYGKQEHFPITEEAPLNPKSVYAVSKIAGEEYVKSYGIPYNIVRLFNVYGENQRQDFVIPRFMHMHPITVYGDGSQIRCFCHVSDAAKGIVRALTSPVTGEIFNIGNTEETSIRELAHLISNEVDYIPYEDSDRPEEREITKRIPSIDKARQMLDYAPFFTLKEGLCLKS